MQVDDPLGIFAGIVVLILSSYATYRSYTFYRLFKMSLPKTFAFRVTIAFGFAILGGIGVIIDSLTPVKLWMVMAACFMAALGVLMTATFQYLKLFVQIAPRDHAEATVLESETSEKNQNFPKGGFTIRREHLEEISPICTGSNGVILISRARNVKELGISVDKSLWLSRIEVPDAVDPTRLHVIMDEVLRFIRERRGNVVVILDGLEYLLLHNEFKSVMKFLAALKDHVLLNNSLLLVALEEKALDRIEYSMLTKEFPPFEVKKFSKIAEKDALFGAIKRESDERGGGEEEGS